RTRHLGRRTWDRRDDLFMEFLTQGRSLERLGPRVAGKTANSGSARLVRAGFRYSASSFARVRSYNPAAALEDSLAVSSEETRMTGAWVGRCIALAAALGCVAVMGCAHAADKDVARKLAHDMGKYKVHLTTEREKVMGTCTYVRAIQP